MPKHYANDLDRAFVALGDGMRRDVLARLAAEGPANVGALASAYDISLPSFSEHLGMLERAGLVERSRDGRHHRIGIKPEVFAQVRAWLEQVEIQVAVAPAAPVADPDLLQRAEALLEAVAAKMAIVAQVLDPALRRALLEATGFSPEGHAVRRLSAAAQASPGLRGELAEAHAAHAALAALVATARAGGASDGLPAAIFPLARCVYGWQAHPILKDAFP
ncbi:MAG: ArsR family transcriptional regulator, partial [Cyanobacteria bacterium RYN_339]|nr:ArsR family transcriptional regulator [Cyanobacteria bacterium RYN_339]